MPKVQETQINPTKKYKAAFKDSVAICHRYLLFLLCIQCHHGLCHNLRMAGESLEIKQKPAEQSGLVHSAKTQAPK